MKRKLYICVVMLASMLAGCSDELFDGSIDNGESVIDSQYYFILSDDGSSDTRAVTYDNDNHSVFSEGDILGAFALQSAGSSSLYTTNLASDESNNNVQYKVKNVTGGQVLVPVDETKKLPERDSNIAYVFYYPYNADFTSSSTANIQYSSWNNQDVVNYKIQANQNSVDGEAEHKSKNYETSDLLWDVVIPTTGTDNTSRVHVEMDHVMANIILKIPSELIKEGTDVKILSRQLYGINIPLYKSGRTNEGSLDETNWTYNTGQYTQGGETSNITMWKYDTDEDGVSTYRAVVLACSGDDGALKANGQYSPNYIFEITTADGTTKHYGVKNRIELQHGRNYIFQVTKGSDEPLIPLPSDDDSWVLDVYNKKGEIVGLLCREYLYYQPTDGYEYTTGTSYPVGTANSTTRHINSQAWVLYKLKSNTKPLVPDLSSGTVLRFVYDVVYGNQNANKVDNVQLTAYWPNEDGTISEDSKQTSSWWPLPHTGYRNAGGVFTVDHGHYWSYYANGVENQWSDTQSYGASSSAEHEYYMHGGKIVWGKTGSQTSTGEDLIGITSFTMPTEKISNATAKLYGHITWDEENGVAINYDAADRNACTYIPHVLTDDKDGKEYPLAKIGYNQFWMTKSYRGTMYRDNGTLKSLEYFNDLENNLDKNPTGLKENTSNKVIAFYSKYTDYSQYKLPVLTSAKAGYMYPFVDCSSSSKDGGIFNPAYYNANGDASQMHVTYTEGSFSYENYATPLYNKATVDLPGIVPIADKSVWNMEYTLPGHNGFEKVYGYYHALQTSKFSSNSYTLRTNSSLTYEQFTSALRGEGYAHGGTTMGSYTANISGFNAKTYGFFSGGISGWGMDGITSDVVFILKSNDSTHVSLFQLPVWSPFSNYDDNYGFKTYELNHTQRNINAYFGQVRFVMHFLGNDNPSSSSAKTRVSDVKKKHQSNNVYITLTE